MRQTMLSLALLFTLGAAAQTRTEIREFNLAGPYAVATPQAFDTVDVQGRKFDDKSLLDALALTSPVTTTYGGQLIPSLQDQRSVGVLSFHLNNQDYLKGKIEVKGPKNYKLFIDDKPVSGTDLSLAPEHHTIALKFLAEPRDTDSLQVSIDAKTAVEYTLSNRHPYTMHNAFDGRRPRQMRLSPDGQYLVMAWQTTERDGKTRWDYELRETRKGQLLRVLPGNVEWLPTSNAYLEEETTDGHRILYKVEPLTGLRTRFAYDIPEGSYTVSPTEDYLIIQSQEEGPKEDPGVFEVTEMDDRQPGWRERGYLCRYDIATGLQQRITFGSKGEYLLDITPDGQRLLIATSRSRLEKRPTTVSDYLLMDARTLQTDTLFAGAEFLGGAQFSPDGRQLLITGTPEAFDRVGCQLPESVTPSMTENELFLYDIATKEVSPLTKDFDPSINGRPYWSAADGQIYFNTEDRDYEHVYSLNPKTGRITPLPLTGDCVYSFDLAAHAPVLAYWSCKTMEPVSAYVYDLKTKKQQQYFDGRTLIRDIDLPHYEDYNFTNSRGDTVYGRFYAPKDYDPAKKYPLLVYYYGGCAPVGRYFDTTYSPVYWTSLGYCAYIVEPSGATGFGQEWASRHVNTAGHGPAEDIIEGTRQLCKDKPFIDSTKIGCMGASYGGFMTMYLQTVTDLFAAAVSHAGIANHTSYWGEGYWGYNYSEVSMANSYPWSHRQLFVDQSPLFNADKIHTPLLLLHGNADTNVPLIESLQMFTALKLLGREVALVEVEGQNHHILDYQKREKWIQTQMAWFARWLKDDPTWWEALYPKKHL